MTQPTSPLLSATRRIDPKLVELIRGLKPGQRIRITQTVRVGSTGTWPAVAEGVVQRHCGGRGSRVPVISTVANRVFTKPEIPARGRKGSLRGKANIPARTAIVLGETIVHLDLGLLPQPILPNCAQIFRADS